ncbi:BON domain-containing protein [Cupriavidus oxalaticus]|uniref:BON domain-containing protein n=1 Tax=Cupriavidus oxalaticus TaxID=96344 RepID=A0A375FYR3_9BURK|nr:BON domain-containing protein [Cupriavidus oxalaticus]QEZ48179.1 BON domain-containing protein [Cupriavidus oxalaticus]QRQ87537.1 BON domain-containing protein [Cupriavidus oxalaticus]QRQ94135.1 BON domain-containing protein [Cupriavidus oxalaticus]WQD82772.1 BON domain-containing protein [Cupriavidus oxalaticus]SPC10679.1 Signal peptide protein [Cupriavidus oxalaticus]
MTNLPTTPETRTGAAGTGRILRATLTAAAVLVSATQLAGCFPVIAGAVGTGVTMATDRRPAATQTVDRGLQMEAESTINSRYSGQARVNVTVFNRKVLLTGEASNDSVKQQVEQYVRGLQNARVVINELEVVNSPGFMTQSQDAYLTSKVKTLLMTADGVPSNSIKITTEKSVVYLLGVVTQQEGDRATDVARNASGVTKVVKAFDYVNDTERARLDAASTAQNPSIDGNVGTPAPVQSVPGVGGPVDAPASMPGEATASPVSSPVASPVALPPGRNLP